MPPKNNKKSGKGKGKANIPLAESGPSSAVPAPAPASAPVEPVTSPESASASAPGPPAAAPNLFSFSQAANTANFSFSSEVPTLGAPMPDPGAPSLSSAFSQSEFDRLQKEHATLRVHYQQLADKLAVPDPSIEKLEKVKQKYDTLCYKYGELGEKYRETEEDRQIHASELGIVTVKWKAVQKELEELKAHVAAKAQQSQQEVEDLKKHMAAKEEQSEYEHHLKDAEWEEQEEKVQELQKQISQLRNEHAIKNDEVENLQNKLQSMKKTQDDAYLLYENQVEEANKEANRAKEELNNLKTLHENLIQHGKYLEGQFSQLKQKHDQLEWAAQSYDSIIADKDALNLQQQATIQKYNNDIRQHEADAAGLRTAADEAQLAYTSANHQLEALKEENRVLKAAPVPQSVSEEQMIAVMEEQNRLNKEIDTLRDDVGRKQARIDELEAQAAYPHQSSSNTPTKKPKAPVEDGTGKLSLDAELAAAYNSDDDEPAVLDFANIMTVDTAPVPPIVRKFKDLAKVMGASVNTAPVPVPAPAPAAATPQPPLAFVHGVSVSSAPVAATPRPAPPYNPPGQVVRPVIIETYPVVDIRKMFLDPMVIGFLSAFVFLVLFLGYHLYHCGDRQAVWLAANEATRQLVVDLRELRARSARQMPGVLARLLGDKFRYDMGIWAGVFMSVDG